MKIGGISKDIRGYNKNRRNKRGHNENRKN